MEKRLPMLWSLAPTVRSVSIFPTWLVLHAEHEPQRQHAEDRSLRRFTGLRCDVPGHYFHPSVCHPVFFRVREDTC